jgi:transcriptional regulator with XRE-family HTH domain
MSTPHVPQHLLGQRVEELRLGLSMSKRELARKAGVSPQTICNIEGGHTAAPRLSRLRSIATVLEVPVEDLLVTLGVVSAPPTPPSPVAAPLPAVRQAAGGAIEVRPHGDLRLGANDLAALARRLGVEFDLLRERQQLAADSAIVPPPNPFDTPGQKS